MGFAGNGYRHGAQCDAADCNPFYAWGSGKRCNAIHAYIFKQVVYKSRALKSQYLSDSWQPGYYFMDVNPIRPPGRNIGLALDVYYRRSPGNHLGILLVVPGK